MRILFLTDTHLRASRPVARLDEDFLATQLGKIEQVRRLAEDADIVIHGGDLADRPDVPHSVVLRAMRALSKFKKPVYIVHGNHDTLGYNASTVESSALGVLLESGVVKTLDYLEIGDVAIYGIHAYDNPTWKLPEGPERHRVICAHKMLTRNPIPGADCIMLDDVDAQTNAHLVLSGDIHTPHEYEGPSGALYLNPGSLTRMNITDRERTPQVAMITLDDSGISYEMHTLDTLPAELVFDVKHYSERMASEAHSKDFVKTYVQYVMSVKGESHRIGDLLREFMEKNGIEEDVRKNVRAYFERAEQEVLGEIKS